MSVRSGTATYDPHDPEQRAELVRALDEARERLQGAKRQPPRARVQQLTLVEEP